MGYCDGLDTKKGVRDNLKMYELYSRTIMVLHL